MSEDMSNSQQSAEIEKRESELERSARLAEALKARSDKIKYVYFLDERLHIPPFPEIECPELYRERLEQALEGVRHGMNSPLIEDTFSCHDGPCSDGSQGRAEFRASLSSMESGKPEDDELFWFLKSNLLSSNAIAGLLSHLAELCTVLPQVEASHFSGMCEEYRVLLKSIQDTHHKIWKHPFKTQALNILPGVSEDQAQCEASIVTKVREFAGRGFKIKDKKDVAHARTYLADALSRLGDEWEDAREIIAGHEDRCPEGMCECFGILELFIEHKKNSYNGNALCRSIAHAHIITQHPECKNETCDCALRLKRVFIETELAPTVRRFLNFTVSYLAKDQESAKSFGCD